MNTQDRELRLEERLFALQQAVAWMAHGEARTSWVRLHGASLDEKEWLVDEIGHLLKRLNDVGRARQP